MKKLFYFSILLATIFFSCSKEEIFPTLKIHTSQSSSRSTFENNTTSWCEGDYLSVLFSANDADCGTYTFNISGDPKDGIFECNTANLDPSASYDIYALHQASAIINNSEASINIGSPTQTQEATSSSHVAQHDPLYGSNTGVSIDNMTVDLQHLASVLTFKIKNGHSTPIEIASVKVSTSNHSKLAGTYALDLKSGELSESSTNESITLSITDAPTLQSGEVMSVWMATAPFDLAQGDSLEFTITTSDGAEYRHTQTMGGAVAFAAGKIKSMKQVIELSQTNLQTTKSIVYDFTQPNNYPADFPTCKVNEVSNWNDNLLGDLLTYNHGGELLSFMSDVKFYHYSNSSGTTNYLRFIHKDKNKKSLIYLPKLKSYKISGVTIVANSNLGGKLTFSILDWNVEKTPSYNTLTFDKDDNITFDADNQYILSIRPKATSITEINCNINSITINYELVNNTP